MAILRDTRYPGRWAARTTNYPQGAFKNKSSPTATDGSYAEQDWLNDWDGFFGRLLTVADITPNGNVDNATSSQYYDALAILFPLITRFKCNVSPSGSLQIPIAGNSSGGSIIINWSQWSATTMATGNNGVYEPQNGVYALWDTPFTTTPLCVFTSVQDVAGVGLQEQSWYSGLTNKGCFILSSCKQPSTAMSGYVFAIGY